MNQKEIPGRLIVIALVALISVYFLAGTIRFFAFELTTPVPTEQEAFRQYLEQKDEIRKSAIRFGLDIQGGVDVLMSIDIDELLRRQLRQVERDIRQRASQADANIRVRSNLADRSITVQLRDPAAGQTILGILQNEAFANLFDTIDSTGLPQQVVVTLKEDFARQEADEALERTIDLLRERIDSLGLMQPTVVAQGARQIRIQLPGETRAEDAVAQVTRLASLEFRLVSPQTFQFRQEDGTIDRTRFDEWPEANRHEIVRSREARQNQAGELEYTENEFIVEREASVVGGDIEEAFPSIASTGLWEIGIRFNRQGMFKFGRLTEENVNRQLAILLDGVLRSAPNINQPIREGRAVITGNFTRDEAVALSRVINTGALPVSLKTESSQVIGAKVGGDSIRASLVALFVGFIGTAIFMISYYGRAGIVAIFAVLINVLVILAAIAAGRGTLTLSGIGGVLLTIGMAVDANVLIYERIREEWKIRKKAIESIVAGFDNALSTIVDANLTTLITALILLQFGQGSVQGFALTMTFGIFATLFTGLYVTRTIFGWLFEPKNIAPMGSMVFLADPKFDFLAVRRYGFALSAIVIMLGFASIVQHGGLIAGTDFSGGVKMQVAFADDSVSQADLRDALARADARLASAEVVNVIGSNDYVITTRLFNDGENALEETSVGIRAALDSAFPNAYETGASEMIGSAVGREFMRRAISALVFASLGILLYVAFRFEFWFGVAAVVALLHDIAVTLGVLTFLNVAITLEVVAALLVVVGYSINDTIIIFDRIRENSRLHMGMPFRKIINLSINQSLNRTLITSATTLFVIFCMLVLGGQGLRDFSLALFIGLIVGTYSSSFVAAPLLAYIAMKKGRALIEADPSLAAVGAKRQAALAAANAAGPAPAPAVETSNLAAAPASISGAATPYQGGDADHDDDSASGSRQNKPVSQKAMARARRKKNRQ